MEKGAKTMRVIMGLVVVLILILIGYFWYGQRSQRIETIEIEPVESEIDPTEIEIDPIEMVLVEGGTFQMGATGNTEHDPIKQVTLSSFSIGKYEVTQKEWQAVMGKNPAKFKGDNQPVENVTWNEAVKFCNRLSEKEGLEPAYTIVGTNVTCDWSADGYRLPTEAEWEYAAKGGKKSKGFNYSGSDNIDDVAWYDENSEDKTHDVGTKAPNELGIHDMTGNVSEWCWDWFDSAYYEIGPKTDPKGADSGDNRINRGANWSYILDFSRVVLRILLSERTQGDLLGFRIARNAK